MKTQIALVVVALLSLALPAGAEDCATWSSEPAIVVGEHYVTEDCFLTDILEAGVPSGCYEYPLSLWIYEESNGLPGLQRGDEMVDNTCHGMVPADTLVR